MLPRAQEGSCWFGTRVFEKLDVIVGQFSVSVLLIGVVDDFVWAYTGVYGPNDDG